MPKPKRDYTTSANHGRNKTRSDEKKAIRGKERARTPKRKVKKATQDARSAFLMQMGYNQQRTNYDIVRPMNDAKRSIMGENTYGAKDGAGANPHVDKFDATKKRLGYNNVGDGSVGGTKNKKISHSVKGRVASSERQKGKAGKGYGDYSPMAESDASETIWNKTDRYRDSGGKHPKKGKSRNKVLWNSKRRNRDKGVKDISFSEHQEQKAARKAKSNRDHEKFLKRRRNVAVASSAIGAAAGIYAGNKLSKFMTGDKKKKKKKDSDDENYTTVKSYKRKRKSQNFSEGKKRRKKKKSRCWSNYKPTPGKEAYSDGSCRKR